MFKGILRSWKNETFRRGAVKMQIKIRVNRFGLEVLEHFLSKCWNDEFNEKLMWLFDLLSHPKTGHKSHVQVPPMELPTHNNWHMLGMKEKNVNFDHLDRHQEVKKKDFEEGTWVEKSWRVIAIDRDVTDNDNALSWWGLDWHSCWAIVWICVRRWKCCATVVSRFDCCKEKQQKCSHKMRREAHFSGSGRRQNIGEWNKHVEWVEEYV